MQSTDATILSYGHLTLLPTHQAEFGVYGVEFFIRHPSPLVTARSRVLRLRHQTRDNGSPKKGNVGL